MKNTKQDKLNKFYVMYKGDEIVSNGTIEEISKKTGLKVENLLWYTYPAAHKREAENYKKSSTRTKIVLVEG